MNKTIEYFNYKRIIVFQKQKNDVKDAKFIINKN